LKFNSAIAACLLAGLLSAACGCAAAIARKEINEFSALHRAAEEALDRAIQAIVQQERMDAGTIWNLQQVLAMRHDDVLSSFVKDEVEKLKGSGYERLINPDAPRTELPDDPGGGAMRLGNSLKATVGIPEARAIAWLTEFLEQPAFGYVLTHQLLAIKWADGTGRALPQSLLDLQPALLDSIAAEQEEATMFSDIYAERVALILMYGSPAEPDAVSWVETMITQQLENGMWDSRPASAGARGNRHPTTWCMFALAAFLESY
jgi:hypothetical protein